MSGRSSNPPGRRGVAKSVDRAIQRPFGGRPNRIQATAPMSARTNTTINQATLGRFRQASESVAMTSRSAQIQKAKTIRKTTPEDKNSKRRTPQSGLAPAESRSG
jgi:hypothetical protein